MSERYIGLLSGTSMDAIDAGLVAFDDSGPCLEARLSIPFPPDLRDRCRALIAGRSAEPLRELGRLDRQLGTAFADAAQQLLTAASVGPEQVSAIGSHGQTIWHAPGDEPPFTLQIADPNIIAAETGIITVADFRRADMAVGGQGAPLAPALHEALFRHGEEPRAVVNIGGIANLTLLPPMGAADTQGFDTGPGNTLLDAWYRQCYRATIDQDGNLASRGRVHEPLLNGLLSDPYFQHSPPKSTGPEYFNLDWLDSYRTRIASDATAADVQATLTELTAVSIARATLQHLPEARLLLVCGGGARNRHLMARLARHLPDQRVESTDEYGVPPEWVEVVLFAWLARTRLHGQPGNLPAVTGANKSVMLGALYAGGQSSRG